MSSYVECSKLEKLLVVYRQAERVAALPDDAPILAIELRRLRFAVGTEAPLAVKNKRSLR